MYEVTARFTLPNLAPLLPPGGRLRTTEQRWETTYFDTAERDLQAVGVDVTCHAGDEQRVMWRLEMGGRLLSEVSDPRTEAVPDELVRLAAGAARGRTLHRIATVTTSQFTTALQTNGGPTAVALFDQTQAASITDGESATLSTRRTIEVRPEGADAKTLAKAVRRKLTAAGDIHKTRRGLAGVERIDGGGGAGGGTGAASAISDYLLAQDRELIAGDLRLRLGEDSVHSTRVAVRRFRSTLRTFARFLDPTQTAQLDAELVWYAGLLGPVRDNEVQLARLTEELEQIPGELQLGPVKAQIVQHLTSELVDDRKRLNEALLSPRYFQLLSTTRQFAQGADPTTSERALTDIVRSRSKKAIRKLSTATQSADPHGALHAARKAAKRARYAVELERERLGRQKSRRLIKRFRALQDTLGEHQDALVSMHLLRRLGSAEGTDAGRNGFTYGLLYQRQAQKADAIVQLVSEM